MVKYADNSFHALKIGFANEIGSICRELGVDSYDVIDVFLADTKLNISPAYLRPGFAFGGSCLPKDLRALVHAARRVDLDLPLLESVLPSNNRHLQRTLDAIVATGRKKVGLVGLSFKPGTDDLRESPLVELAERLLGKGFELRIFDPVVSYSSLVGANREIRRGAPSPSQQAPLPRTRRRARARRRCASWAYAFPSSTAEWRPDQIVFDLVRSPEPRHPARGRGIRWRAW